MDTHPLRVYEVGSESFSFICCEGTTISSDSSSRKLIKGLRLRKYSKKLIEAKDGMLLQQKQETFKRIKEVRFSDSSFRVVSESTSS